MTTRYRLRKKTDFDGTWFYIETAHTLSDGTVSWWPVFSCATEKKALEMFEEIGQENEEILKEKEV